MSTTADPPAPQKAARVAPAPTLRFVDGPLAGEAVRLDADEATLGRRQDNTYRVDDPSVSRVHARLTKAGSAVVVTDLANRGTTSVNGEVISGPRALHHGDEIAFGRVHARYEDPVAAATDDEATMVMDMPSVRDTGGVSLSPRQQEVLELAAEGLTSNEVGERLGITERTVKAYLQEIYDKLGARNRAGAVAEAVRRGLL